MALDDVLRQDPNRKAELARPIEGLLMDTDTAAQNFLNTHGVAMAYICSVGEIPKEVDYRSFLPNSNGMAIYVLPDGHDVIPSHQSYSRPN